MTEEEKTEFKRMKQQVDVVTEISHTVSEKMDNIYYAIVGNSLSKDGGLVQQIKDMKQQQTNFEKEIEAITILSDAFLETAKMRQKSFTCIGVYTNFCGGRF